MFDEIQSSFLYRNIATVTTLSDWVLFSKEHLLYTAVWQRQILKTYLTEYPFVLSMLYSLHAKYKWFFIAYGDKYFLSSLLVELEHSYKRQAIETPSYKIFFMEKKTVLQLLRFDIFWKHIGAVTKKLKTRLKPGYFYRTTSLYCNTKKKNSALLKSRLCMKDMSVPPFTSARYKSVAHAGCCDPV